MTASTPHDQLSEFVNYTLANYNDEGVVHFAEAVRKSSSDFIDAGVPLFHGTDRKPRYGTIHQEARLMTDEYAGGSYAHGRALFFNYIFERLYGIRGMRTSALFTTTNRTSALEYGRACSIYPKNGATYVFIPKVKDSISVISNIMWEALSRFENGSRLEGVQTIHDKLLSTYRPPMSADEVKPYLISFYEKELNRENQNDVSVAIRKGITAMFEGTLDNSDLIRSSDISQYVISHNPIDLQGCLELSRNTEVMILCPEVPYTRT